MPTLHPYPCFIRALLVLLLAALFLPACNRQEPVVTTPASAPATAPAPAQIVEPAPKPTIALAADASCITPACHARYKNAAYIHGPIAAGSCFSCHQPDQGQHHYPLARSGNATCTFCHLVSGSKLHQHKALDTITAPPKSLTFASAGPLLAPPTTTPTTPIDYATPAAAATPGTPQAGCLNCHDPHISRAKFLLAADTIQDLCARCHNVPLKKFAHEPFAAGQCTVCHQPHESDYKSLLRNADGPEQCFGCHQEKRQALANSPHVHPAAKQACTTCHSPHATDNIAQLKLPVNETCLNCHVQIKDELAKAKQVHGAVAGGNGNCASCHDAHASQQPAELKARTDKVCLTCHNDAIKTKDGRTISALGKVLASTNLHGPVKTGSCSECHKPHAASQPHLLKVESPVGFYQPFDIKSYALCFSCHDQQLVLKDKTTGLTNFRDGERNLHFLHVNRPDKGRTCKTCHEVHGSNLPKHMAASVPFDGSTWAMPIHYEQTADGGTCTSACHDEKSYHRTPAPIPPAKGGQP